MNYHAYIMAKYASKKEKKRDGARLLTQIGGGLVGLKGGAALGGMASLPLLATGRLGLVPLAIGTGLVGGTYAGVKGAGKLYDWYTRDPNTKTAAIAAEYTSNRYRQFKRDLAKLKPQARAEYTTEEIKRTLENLAEQIRQHNLKMETSQEKLRQAQARVDESKAALKKFDANIERMKRQGKIRGAAALAIGGGIAAGLGVRGLLKRRREAEQTPVVVA